MENGKWKIPGSLLLTPGYWLLATGFYLPTPPHPCVPEGNNPHSALFIRYSLFFILTSKTPDYWFLSR